MSAHVSARRGGRLTYAVLICAVLVSAFPLYWTLVAASRSNAELARPIPALLPGPRLLDLSLIH
ncbi:hypothetical protein VR46_13205, partial [Streptomyces sp. NRRL S-444]